MTKEEFRQRWESNKDGGGITFDDIASCAVAWGISQKPKLCPMTEIRYRVLRAAGVKDAEEYHPEDS